MKTEWTPGPWIIKDEPDAYGYRVLGADGSMICRPMGLNVLQREANARLIALAPALAEALREMVKQQPQLRPASGEPIEAHPELESVWIQARALLAKLEQPQAS